MKIDVVDVAQFQAEGSEAQSPSNMAGSIGVGIDSGWSACREKPVL